MLIDFCDALLTRSDLAWLDAQASELSETPEEHKELRDCLMISLYWDALAPLINPNR